MKQVFKYCISVWLTTAVAGPIFIALVSILVYKEKNDLGEYWWAGLFAWLFTIVLSTPVLGIIYLLSLVLIKLQLKINTIKTILTILSPLLCMLPLLLLALRPVFLTVRELNSFYLPYCVPLLVCIWVYKLKPVDNASGNVETSPN
jgi:hypothetical protein